MDKWILESKLESSLSCGVMIQKAKSVFTNNLVSEMKKLKIFVRSLSLGATQYWFLTPGLLNTRFQM